MHIIHDWIMFCFYIPLCTSAAYPVCVGDGGTGDGGVGDGGVGDEGTGDGGVGDGVQEAGRRDRKWGWGNELEKLTCIINMTNVN